MTETPLRPAAEIAAEVSRPYPGDSAEYRRARTALLAEEIELRRHIERVAAQRRALPEGPPVKDYRFDDERGRSVSLAELFGRHDTLVTYQWMYGPKRARPCPMCTSLLGSLDGPARDLDQRIAFAVIGRSPVERQLAFARERGWRHLRFYRGSDEFARDYRGLGDDDADWPAFDVWVQRDGVVRHFYGEEFGGTQDPGQDPRGAPDQALWNILDMTPGGRGTDWYPALDYPPPPG